MFAPFGIYKERDSGFTYCKGERRLWPLWFIIPAFILATILSVGAIFGHNKTGEGDRYGFVTSVERTGVFWKTWTVYFKTDTQSTWEDNYCATDPATIAQLRYAGQTHERVRIHYEEHFAFASGCTFGSDPNITAILGA